MPQFQLSSFILILSKVDLLPGKLTNSPVKQHWPDYDGPPDDVQCVTEFFRNKFLSFPEAVDRKIQVYVTDLTDTGSTRQILEQILPEPAHEQPRSTKNVHQLSSNRSEGIKQARNKGRKRFNSLASAYDAERLRGPREQDHEKRLEDLKRNLLGNHGEEAEERFSKEMANQVLSKDAWGPIMDAHKRAIKQHTKGTSVG